MELLERLITKALEALLACLLLAMVSIVVTLVVLRYCFNASITGANEWVTILFVYSTAIGAAVACRHNGHIAISVAVTALPATLRWVSNRLSLAGVAILNAVMVAQSVEWIRVTGGYLMPATGFPRYVAQLSVTIGCGLAFAYCVLLIFAAVPAADSTTTEDPP